MPPVFTLGAVTLDGGTRTYFEALDAGDVGITDEQSLDLSEHTSTTNLAAFNNGDGVTTVEGNDFQVVLTDGTTVDVDISSAVTVQDLLDTIAASADAVVSDRLLATITADGHAIMLIDTGDGTLDLEVTALNDSPAAEDLGILSVGTKTTLAGLSTVTNVENDLRVTLSDGTERYFDLTGLQSVQGVMRHLTDAYGGLAVTINDSGTGLNLADNAGGSGNLQVEELNGATAATDLGILGTGTGNTLLGTSIVSGVVTLDGRHDDDTLIGTSNDDELTGAGGADTITGGDGIDTIVETADANFLLTNNALTIGDNGVDVLSEIEMATLTGGASANVIDASAFTAGSVTLDGAGGDDVITGGTGDDRLTGGAGIDIITGGPGTDTLVESGDARFILTDTTLDMADGTNESVTVTVDPEVTAGGFTLTYDEQTTRTVDYDAASVYVRSALAALSNIASDDIQVIQTDADAGWTITFVNNQGGLNQPDISVTGVDLVGGGVDAVVTHGSPAGTANNTLSGIEQAEFTGGDRGNRMDASAFTLGPVVFIGGYGNDELIGSQHADRIEGGFGYDSITGNEGNDQLDGGEAGDTIMASRDVNFTLTNHTLTITGDSLSETEIDSLSGFEYANLAGGATANIIDVSLFTGLSTETRGYQLNDARGLGVVDGLSSPATDLESTTPLSIFHDGAGIGVADGNDFQVTLTDGSTVEVDLSSAATVEDTFNAIMDSDTSGRLTASVDDIGTAIQLVDSQDGGSDLAVTSLGSSTAAATLGIEGAGQGTTLRGLPIFDLDSDLRIVLTDGTAVYIDLDHVENVQDILDAITESHAELTATLDDFELAIVITDTTGGSGRVEVQNFNGSTTASILGIEAVATSLDPSTITGSPIGIAKAVIDGKGGADSITGSSGNDRLTGGDGADVISGGLGTDTIVETRDTDFTLTDTSLTIGTEGTDQLNFIETAILTGGAGVNRIDASAFTVGSVMLSSGGGLDNLIGTDWDDQFIIQIGGLTHPADENDSANQVAVTVGSSTDDEIIIQGTGTILTQADMNWVDLTCVLECTETVIQGNKEKVINSDIFTYGEDIKIKAPIIRINAKIETTNVSNDSAGDITLSGDHIFIDNGATLNAKPQFGEAGKIAIKTRGYSSFVTDGKDDGGLFGFVNYDYIGLGHHHWPRHLESRRSGYFFDR